MKKGLSRKVMEIALVAAAAMTVFAGIASAGSGQIVENEIASSAVVVFSEKFESGWGSWYADNGVWEVGNSTVVNCHGGSNCAATVLNGNYPSYTASRLISPSIQLPAVSPGEEILLRFWQWFSYGSYGSGQVIISFFNTTSGLWEDKNMGTFASGSSPLWSLADIDLTPFAGKKIRIAFSHSSDYYTSTGWYIDDVEITKSIPVFSGSFESGWNGWYADHGVWQVGNSTIVNCHGGSNCAATVLNGNYPSYTASRLISSSKQLPTVSPGEEIHLRFWLWFSYGSYGSGQVQISIYNTTAGLWENWQNLGNPFSGSSPLWSLADRDLTPFAGKKIRIAFSHSSDYYTSTGWYIDDISLILPPSISVTSPNGGEVWQAGTNRTIRWTYSGNPGSLVNITLLKGGKFNLTIKSGTSIGSGIYNWTIPPKQAPGTDYKVKVTSTTNTAYRDTSNANFTISTSATGITVVSPNGGEVWQTGTTKTIRWTYSGTPGSLVNITLLKGGKFNLTINKSALIGSSGAGLYNWTIKSTQTPGTDYKVKITSTANPKYNDTSNNNFTISAPCKVSTIYGYKFNDANDNKTKDKGEAGLPNWTINLKGYDTCTRKLVSTTIKTNATGYFAFKNVNTGVYVLSEEFVSGWLPTTDAAYTLRVPLNSITIRKDFGNKKFI